MDAAGSLVCCLYPQCGIALSGLCGHSQSEPRTGGGVKNPVSYTHLDVYKRQGAVSQTSWGKGKCILRAACACGRLQSHTKKPQKCYDHYVFQRGHPVQGIEGTDIKGTGVLPEMCIRDSYYGVSIRCIK